MAKHIEIQSACCAHEECSSSEKHRDELVAMADLPSTQYHIRNMDCPTEERLIRNKLEGMQGVEQLDFKLMSRLLTVHHQAGRENAVLEALKSIGMDAKPMSETADGAAWMQYRIEDMCCPTEERVIRNKLQAMSGIVGLEFNLMNRVLSVRHRLPSQEPILAALKSIGMHAEPLQAETSGVAPHDAETGFLSGAQKIMLAVSGITAATAEILAWTHHSDSSPLVIALALLSILTGGLPTLRKGWIALKTFTLNINFLMSLAVIGGMAIGQWPEAAMVIFLFAVAELIEGLSLDRARNAVHGLMRLAPETATMRGPEGAWSVVPTASIPAGAQIRVKPGERIALDGKVVAGESSVNQSPITGESMPVDKHAGDVVYAGTINEHGVLDIEVSANSGDSTLSRIVRVIEETQGNQAPMQRFVDQFARRYTPAVVVVALLVACIPPLVFSAPFTDWLYKALVMLVIACPCALVVSTPVTVVSGLTAAARRGILIKGGQFLEIGHRLKVIAMDKTGTLTLGKPAVTTVKAMSRSSQEEVMLLAASLNAHSTHPLATAIVQAGPASSALKTVERFEALPGRGVKGRIDGVMYYLGNHRLLEELGRCSPGIEAVLNELEEQAQTAIILSSDEAVLGIIGLADVLRPQMPELVRKLDGLGVSLVMLTGDNVKTAQRISEQLGIAEFKGELLPQDKLEEIKRLQAKFGAVGMVGDGVNDAPALAQAQVGFAMGAMGSDTAIETADVALMDDDLNKLPAFIQLSKDTRRILIQNIAAALTIKAVFFAMALAGMATLWMAVFADVGASLLVVFNGLRLLRSVRQV